MSIFDQSYNWHEFPEKTKDELNKVSSSFCLAKWAQSTIHFQLGRTHSCHNLGTHEIPRPLPDDNFSALHNTPIKLQQRAQMLEGQQSKECNYCWAVENLNSKNLSDRLLQSSTTWAAPAAQEIYNSGLGENFNPRYLEISFSSVCNLRCSYCSAQYSSSWAEEIRFYGAYSTGNGNQESSILPEANNPYIETFHKWWPELKKDLRVLRITGGEPLMSKNTWQILDSICTDPLPHLQLAINSNLSVSDRLIDKLIGKFKIISSEKRVKNITLFTSVEAIGDHAEYIRNGLDYKKFISNVEKLLLAIPDLRITFMATFCALSIFTYLDLLKEVIRLRKKYFQNGRPLRVGISTSYLRNPEHLTVDILPENLRGLVAPILEFMNSEKYHMQTNPYGFTKSEIAMMENVYTWMNRPVPENLRQELRRKFKQFFTEHDCRRGTKLMNTFPELIF